MLNAKIHETNKPLKMKIEIEVTSTQKVEPRSSYSRFTKKLSQSNNRCEIFGFFLLSFPQNERKMY